MNAAPGYTCANCGHIELPDPLNLRRHAPFSCKRCGKDYRYSAAPSNSASSQSSPDQTGAVAAVFGLIVGESMKYGQKLNVLVGLVIALITFLYCISQDGFVFGVNLNHVLGGIIDSNLPWGVALLWALGLGFVGMIFVVGLLSIAIKLSIIAFAILAIFAVIYYLGGWG